MKLARNLVLGLVFLVLVYGGVYRFLFSEPVRASMLHGDGDLSDFEKLQRKFFMPAGEIDLHIKYDRPARKRLRGHWIRINPNNGDFVTISDKDTCTFQLGKFRSSGKGTIERPFSGYSVAFQDGDRTCELSFEAGSFFHPEARPDSASAMIGIWKVAPSDPNVHFYEFIRAPAP
jgi:hypothetical protein